MDSKKFILATIAGTIISFIAGFLIFGFALNNYMAANSTMSAEPDMLTLGIGHLLFSALTTYIFMQWAGISTVSGGLKAGALIGLLVSLGYNFVLLSVSDLFNGITPAIVDAIGSALLWAAGGAAVGWVLGRGADS